MCKSTHGFPTKLKFATHNHKGLESQRSLLVGEENFKAKPNGFFKLQKKSITIHPTGHLNGGRRQTQRSARVKPSTSQCLDISLLNIELQLSDRIPVTSPALDCVVFLLEAPKRTCDCNLPLSLSFSLSAPPVLTPKVIGVAIARYDFSSRDTRELSLQEGDVVKIYTKAGANGWWRGEVNGRVRLLSASSHLKS